MEKPMRSRVVSAKLPEEVYKEFVLRVPEGDRSNFIRIAITEKLQKTPRPDKIFELERKIEDMRIDMSMIKKSLADLEILTFDKGRINPHAFCIDEIDHEIMDYLLHYKGATTTEIAESTRTNRWMILNRLRKIEKRSRKQLGKAIIEYYSGQRLGKRKAWWMKQEFVDARAQ